METKDAVTALAALAHGHRLEIFRRLMGHGATGLPAGAIADHLSIAPSSLSHHLAQLERAGLLRSWRVQRNVFYAVDIEGTRRLVAFLTEECCQGHPEICGYGVEPECSSQAAGAEPADANGRKIGTFDQGENR